MNRLHSNETRAEFKRMLFMQRDAAVQGSVQSATTQGDVLASVPLTFALRAIPDAGASEGVAKATDEAEESGRGYRVAFRATDSEVDREGDRIITSGIDTAQWEAAGSVLFGHNGYNPTSVVGKPVAINRTDSTMDVMVEFAPEAVSPAAAMVGRLVRDGFLRGASVGLIVKAFIESTERGGYRPLDIVESELLELSVTPVPVNPRALVLGERVADAQRAFEDAAQDAVQSTEQPAAHTMGLYFKGIADALSKI